MKKADRYILLAVVALIALAGGAMLLLRGGDRLQVTVQVNGEVVMRQPLDGAERTRRIEAGGGFNEVRIGNGSAAVMHADCPDKLCVQRGEIDEAGQSAVCLPHKLVVSIDGKGSVDTIAE